MGTSTTNKTQPTQQSVTAFLDTVSDPIQRKDAKAILALMKRVTGEKPQMWGAAMVGFGRYRYRYESGREGDAMRIGFSPRKGQMALYLMLGLSDQSAVVTRLGKVKTGKGCLYIKKLAEVDLAVLEELLRASWALMQEKYPVG